MASGRLRYVVLSLAVFYFLVLTVPGFLYPGLSFPADFFTPLFNTMAYSTAATLAGLPVALLLAFYASRREIGGIIPVLTFSTAIPHTAIGLLLLPLFTRFGIVDTAPAIIVAMIIVSLPIGTGSLISAFASTQKSLDEFLQPLGLNDLQIIGLHVRASSLGVVASVILMWLRCFSELGAFLIVANRPLTVGVYLFELFNRGGAAAAVLFSLVLAVTGLLFSTVLYVISRKAGVR
ncbi:MAG: hypothetical protein RMI43_03825 [Candidatus Caldarchaeum sp.]|nr:hypothetical protein [Candidatus Caldarchaeum sp.]